MQLANRTLSRHFMLQSHNVMRSEHIYWHVRLVVLAFRNIFKQKFTDWKKIGQFQFQFLELKKNVIASKLRWNIFLVAHFKVTDIGSVQSHYLIQCWPRFMTPYGPSIPYDIINNDAFMSPALMPINVRTLCAFFANNCNCPIFLFLSV